jgi:hypothetical protein
MGKFYVAFLFNILLLCRISPVFAQQQTADQSSQKELINLSANAKDRFTAGYKKALLLAPLRGWTIKRNNKSG